MSRHSSHQPPQRAGLNRPPSAKAATRAPNSKAAAGGKDHDHGASRSHRRGFKRYRAWEEALQRNRDPDLNPPPSNAGTPLDQPNANSFPIAYEQQPLFSSVGSAPSSNGYVPQRTAMFQQLPHNAPVGPAHTFQGEVTFAPRGGLQQQPTSVGNHFQDMLVPSIESVHPAPARPSFFAGVPPVRTSDHMDHSSLRHGMQYHHGQPPPLAQPLGRDDYNSGPRVISDHMPHGRVGPGGFLAEGPLQTFGQRDANQSNSDYRGNQGPASSLPHSAARVHEAAPSSDQPVADRIVLNAAQPGSRLNPILMEDRGGFYERVAAQPEPVMPTREPNRNVGGRRLVHQVPQAPDRHIVVSQEEGSRILQESQGTFGVEIIPIPRSGTVPHLAHPHSAHVVSRIPLNPWERGPHVDIERSRIFANDCGPGSRPASGEYRAPPPEPYREG